MSGLFQLVEDTVARSAWRARMLATAQAPESLFTAIQPEESGLERTVYVSETFDTPFVIIDSRSGKHFAPDEHAQVLALGEVSGVMPLVDWWLEMNVDALRRYVQGDCDSIDFFAAMKKLDEAVHLDEMANFREGRFNVSITF